MPTTFPLILFIKKKKICHVIIKYELSVEISTISKKYIYSYSKVPVTMKKRGQKQRKQSHPITRNYQTYPCPLHGEPAPVITKWYIVKPSDGISSIAIILKINKSKPCNSMSKSDMEIMMRDICYIHTTFGTSAKPGFLSLR